MESEQLSSEKIQIVIGHAGQSIAFDCTPAGAAKFSRRLREKGVYLLIFCSGNPASSVVCEDGPEPNNSDLVVTGQGDFQRRHNPDPKINWSNVLFFVCLAVLAAATWEVWSRHLW